MELIWTLAMEGGCIVEGKLNRGIVRPKHCAIHFVNIPAKGKLRVATAEECLPN